MASSMSENEKEYWSVNEKDCGFLPVSRALEDVPYELTDHDDLLRNLLPLAREGLLREKISQLPYIELVLTEAELLRVQGNYELRWIRLTPGQEQETAFAVFSMLASAYVHARTAVGLEEDKPEPIVLPPCVAVPLKRLAAQVKRLPILDYATCVLSNWKLVDNTCSVSLENVKILRTFTGTSSEEWFYKIHVVIEAYGGQAISAIYEAMDILHDATSRPFLELTPEDLLDKAEKVNFCLKRLAAALAMMNETLGQMPKGCRYDQFYDIVRPWLSGWPKAGVIYAEDIDTFPEPMVLGGGSGAQSSLLPCIDAFLGVKYAVDDADVKCPGMKKFVEQLSRYRLHMPLEHVRTIDRLESGDSIRVFISLCNSSVGKYYPHKKAKDVDPYVESSPEGRSTQSNPQEESERRGSLESIPLLTRERLRIDASKLGDELFEVRQMYNEAVEALLAFRRKHVGFASMYITRRAKQKAMRLKDENLQDDLLKQATVGTGGSTFAKHLLNHINDTRSVLYPLRLPPSAGVDVEEELGLGNSEGDPIGLLSSSYTPPETNRSWYEYSLYERLKDQVDKLASLFVIQKDT